VRFAKDHYLVDFGRYELRFRELPYSDMVMSWPGYLSRGGPQASDFVIDAGAYDGSFSVLAARLVGPRGRVLALEADPTVFRRLCDNIALNGASNIEPVNLGVWRGRSKLAFLGDGSFDGRFIDGECDDPRALTLDVAAVDELMRDQDLDRTRLFLKMDVEGAELEALLGAENTLRRCQRAEVVVASYHNLGGYSTSARVEALLRQFGYQAETGHPIHPTTFGWK
jgi:FkbM family methyltransferase